jgi:acyl-coenzyme A thioesterase PaaI-like protein
MQAFQDQFKNNHCYGCGPNNEQGLRIKSHWSGEGETEATCLYTPQAYQCAGPRQYLNGGIIATVFDCHAVCTAMAKAYLMAGRAIGEGEFIWFATGRLDVSYLKPAPIDQEIKFVASIVEAREKKITLDCSLSATGEICATAHVIAIRVPLGWF